MSWCLNRPLIYSWSGMYLHAWQCDTRNISQYICASCLDGPSCLVSRRGARRAPCSRWPVTGSGVSRTSTGRRRERTATGGTWKRKGDVWRYRTRTHISKPVSWLLCLFVRLFAGRNRYHRWSVFFRLVVLFCLAFFCYKPRL